MDFIEVGGDGRWGGVGVGVAVGVGVGGPALGHRAVGRSAGTAPAAAAPASPPGVSKAAPPATPIPHPQGHDLHRRLRRRRGAAKDARPRRPEQTHEGVCVWGGGWIGCRCGGTGRGGAAADLLRAPAAQQRGRATALTRPLPRPSPPPPPGHLLHRRGRRHPHLPRQPRVSPWPRAQHAPCPPEPAASALCPAPPPCAPPRPAPMPSSALTQRPPPPAPPPPSSPRPAAPPPKGLRTLLLQRPQGARLPRGPPPAAHQVQAAPRGQVGPWASPAPGPWFQGPFWVVWPPMPRRQPAAHCVQAPPRGQAEACRRGRLPSQALVWAQGPWLVPPQRPSWPLPAAPPAARPPGRSRPRRQPAARRVPGAPRRALPQSGPKTGPASRLH
jgi:hypothetical protein